MKERLLTAYIFGSFFSISVQAIENNVTSPDVKTRSQVTTQTVEEPDIQSRLIRPTIKSYTEDADQLLLLKQKLEIEKIKSEINKVHSESISSRVVATTPAAVTNIKTNISSGTSADGNNGVILKGIYGLVNNRVAQMIVNNSLVELKSGDSISGITIKNITSQTVTYQNKGGVHTIGITKTTRVTNSNLGNISGLPSLPQINGPNR